MSEFHTAVVDDVAFTGIPHTMRWILDIFMGSIFHYNLVCSDWS